MAGNSAVPSVVGGRGIESGSAFEVKPVDVSHLFGIFAEASKYPHPITPDKCLMIEATNKSPCSRPGECLEVEIANVVQDIIVVPSDSANYEKFVFVEHGSVSGSSFWNRAGHGRLCPVRSLQVEYNEVGEISSVLILTTEDEELVPLIEGGSMPCLSLGRVLYAWYSINTYPF